MKDTLKERVAKVYFGLRQHKSHGITTHKYDREERLQIAISALHAVIEAGSWSDAVTIATCALRDIDAKKKEE